MIRVLEHGKDIVDKMNTSDSKYLIGRNMYGQNSRGKDSKSRIIT